MSSTPNSKRSTRTRGKGMTLSMMRPAMAGKVIMSMAAMAIASQKGLPRRRLRVLSKTSSKHPPKSWKLKSQR